MKAIIFVICFGVVSSFILFTFVEIQRIVKSSIFNSSIKESINSSTSSNNIQEAHELLPLITSSGADSAFSRENLKRF